MKTVLAIAGSDPSGGAGIQADIKTIAAHGLYGMSVITALTAQNTMGVYGTYAVSRDFVWAQLKAVIEDIYPDAVKIGMLPDIDVMEVVAECLDKYKVKNVVLDPVFSSTSGTELSKAEAHDFMVKELFKRATLVTPNIPEADVIYHICNKYHICEDGTISGKGVLNSTETVFTSQKSIEDVASFLVGDLDCNILIKGGHSFFNKEGEVMDCLCLRGDNPEPVIKWLSSKKIDNPNTHGTGCTLSSAIACNLAFGMNLENATKNGKEYVSACIGAGLKLGHGRGPMEHIYKKL